jgi:hypothetical protein
MAVHRIWNRILRSFRRNKPTLLTQIGLSTRVFNCLHQSRHDRFGPGLGLSTVEELLGYSAQELLRIRSFGSNSLLELRDRLDEHGFTEFGLANRVLLEKLEEKKRQKFLDDIVRASAPVYDHTVPSPYQVGEEPVDMHRRVGTISHHRDIPIGLREFLETDPWERRRDEISKRPKDIQDGQ